MGEQHIVFEHVLRATPEAVEKAVYQRVTTGEKDIATVVARLAELFGTTKGDVYAVLGITSSKVSRGPEMNVEILDRAGATLKLYASVVSMIGADAAVRWLNDPSRHLDGKRPLDLLGSNLGRQRLEGMVRALADGAYL